MKRELEKVPTGIRGFDEITFGGIPKGRPTLICGSAGSGKTLMALEIIVRGAVDFGEPGVFLAFEETKEDLIKNVASMGFDLEELQRKKLIYIDYVYVDTRGYTETGEYDLEGLFIRIEGAVEAIGAKRLAIDTMEVLFAGFTNAALLRAELRRLFLWLKEKKLTTIVTGEQGTGAFLTRHGIEEYVADCVIVLSHRIFNEVFTRRLQIVKYRGSFHETNEFPFLIGRDGISLLPITSLKLEFVASNDRIGTGIRELDASLGGKGYYRGSSILFSGSSGTGKSSFAAAFAKANSDHGGKTLFFSYEESADELLRNWRVIGIDLKKNVENGTMKIVSARPTNSGLERHLGEFIREIEEFKPTLVIVDQISTLSHCGSDLQIYSILTRMIDYLKSLNITFFMTILSSPSRGVDFSYGIDSIIDTWVDLQNHEVDGVLKRTLKIIKSRGMSHSNVVQQFTIGSNGISIDTKEGVSEKSRS